MKEWSERCRDQHSCWLVLRLEQCKIVWLALEGTVQTLKGNDRFYWQRAQSAACCWSDREEAYQQARASGGLLYRYDRGATS